MSTVPKCLLSPAEYLARERLADVRSEFYRGEMFAMAGATWEHTLIKDNLAREARSITVAEIILALEGPIGFTECSVVKGLCNMERSCAIMSNSQIIGDAFRGFYGCN